MAQKSYKQSIRQLIESLANCLVGINVLLEFGFGTLTN